MPGKSAYLQSFNYVQAQCLLQEGSSPGSPMTGSRLMFESPRPISKLCANKSAFKQGGARLTTAHCCLAAAQLLGSNPLLPTRLTPAPSSGKAAVTVATLQSRLEKMGLSQHPCTEQAYCCGQCAG